ncbi:MAG TPA: hypothetical protein VEJ18_13580 [Planctomycetota bacterium]|nr:hypothetical protein [Planctomycetota bacterium]
MEMRRVRWTAEAAVLLAAATACLGLAAATAFDLPFASRSDGVVALALPWLGLLIYVGLAVAVLRRPDDPRPGWVLGGCLFVHAALVLEMVRSGAVCPGFAAAAALAVAAAAARLVRRPTDFGGLVLGLLAGTVFGRFQPYERVEGVATRWLWPARRLSALPAFVERALLASCEHPARVRILVYEKDCKG